MGILACAETHTYVPAQTVAIDILQKGSNMKFDLVRAWKDENYRQSLSASQRELLPANPVGELTDAEMEMVYGGGGGGGGGGPMVTPAAPVAPIAPAIHSVYHRTAAVGTASAAAASSEIRAHSWGFACDISIFSVNALTKGVIGVDDLINVLSPNSQCCLNSD
jgi:mersacidin/lichenicidin family type 2 lantibiotic